MDRGVGKVDPETVRVHRLTVDIDLAGIAAGLVAFGQAQRQDGAFCLLVGADLRMYPELRGFTVVRIRKIEWLVCVAGT